MIQKLQPDCPDFRVRDIILPNSGGPGHAPEVPMLIRRKQLECLEEDRLRRFAAGILSLIRALCPGHTRGMSDADLQLRTLESIQAGARFGIRRDNDLVVFTALSVRIAPRFYDDPAVRRYLDDPLLARDECMARLTREIPHSEWARIKEP